MQENENVENNDTDYIEQIKALKENSVSKDVYLKLKEENKKLIKSLVDGTPVESGEPGAVKPQSIQELTDAFYNGYDKMSNRELTEKILKIREKTLEETGKDLFMPSDKTYIPTQDDVNTVNNLVVALQNCLDIANGNDEVFNRELDRITIKQ